MTKAHVALSLAIFCGFVACASRTTPPAPPGPPETVPAASTPPAFSAYVVASAVPSGPGAASSVAQEPAPEKPAPEKPAPAAEDGDPGELLKTPAEKRAALAAAIVSKADLVIGKLRIPGPCYKTARHAAILRNLAGTRGNLFPQNAGQPSVDLDGDGLPDDIHHMGAVNITSHYEVYIRRGDCGYHVGSIDTESNLSVAETKTLGLFDLEGPKACRMECCPTKMMRYAFNGRRYAKNKTWFLDEDCSSDSTLYPP